MLRSEPGLCLETGGAVSVAVGDFGTRIVKAYSQNVFSIRTVLIDPCSVIKGLRRSYLRKSRVVRTTHDLIDLIRRHPQLNLIVLCSGKILNQA